jgi:GNAT superfamily N-acetyltransferase
MYLEKIDNPCWYSLSETHRNFAINYNGIKFYLPSYCPFGAYINPDATEMGIEAYAMLTKNFYVIGNKPKFSNTVQLQKELICNQMILDSQIQMNIQEQIIELRKSHENDLIDLVNLVQPGYFKIRTPELGRYFGIYKDEKLIAVTGERMKMTEYTEVSAIVTHPLHTGRSYAKQLIAHTTNAIFAENKIPYLHVTNSNAVAIHLYKKLGFKTRREISFWNFNEIS